MATVLSRKPGASGGGGAPSGPAGGDLGGTYPNPEVDVVDNDILGSGTPGATTYLRGDRAWVIPPGHEFSYVQITADVSITATSAATANTIVTAGAVVFDGSTIAMVEFFTERAVIPNANALVFNLYDGSTDLGRIGHAGNGASAADGIPVFAARRLTPTAASHTYSIRAWVTAGTGTIEAGAGGTDTELPAFIRITKV